MKQSINLFFFFILVLNFGIQAMDKPRRKTWFEIEPDYNPIHAIILKRDFTALEELIKSNKATIEDTKGRKGNPIDTPLLTAAKDDRFINGLTLLLQSGANVLAKDDLNANALHMAARERNFEAIPLLVKYGVPLNEKDSFGESPLYAAINTTPFGPTHENAQLKTVQALIDAKADVNIAESGRTSRGYTPLQLAAINNKPSIIKILLQNGALREARDKIGKTALQIAEENNKVESIRALITTISPQDIQHVIPTIIALKLKPATTFPRDVNLLIEKQIIPAIVNEKLALAKKYLPNISQETLRQEIINNINRAIRNSPQIQASTAQTIVVE